jgi:hypothetical protein
VPFSSVTSTAGRSTRLPARININILRQNRQQMQENLIAACGLLRRCVYSKASAAPSKKGAAEKFRRQEEVKLRTTTSG